MTTTDEDINSSSHGAGGIVEEKGAPSDNHNVRGFCVSQPVVVVLLVSAAVLGSLTYTFTKETKTTTPSSGKYIERGDGFAGFC
jgi:hypothetical protein